MPLYNSSYLKSLAREKRGVINEKQNLYSRSRGADRSQSFDIFLSHSFLDEEDVEGIYIELTELGFSVYVDWIVDGQLDRDKVTQESAELIRWRLKSSRSLLLALSENAKFSKWIPWELGYVDGNVSNCAVFPVAAGTGHKTSFHRTEYLLLYPFIKRDDIGTYSQNLYAVNSGNDYVQLRDFVKSNRQPHYQTRNIEFL